MQPFSPYISSGFGHSAAAEADQNHDGHLEASEYVKLRLAQWTYDARTIKSSFNESYINTYITYLEKLTPSQLKGEFIEFRGDNSQFFPHGIDLPSDSQFEQLTEAAHRVALDIRVGRQQFANRPTAQFWEALDNLRLSEGRALSQEGVEDGHTIARAGKLLWQKASEALASPAHHAPDRSKNTAATKAK